MIGWWRVEVSRIDLADIAGTPGERGRYAVSEEVPAAEGERRLRGYEVLGPVVGELVVENAGVLLLVRGEIRAVVRVNCVRCLSLCECPLTMKVEEEFATAETAPDVLTIDREEPETSAIANYVLDVSELVRQQLAVNLPMAQLCREDCRGICPECGQNLNLGPCACSKAPADSRWGRLADLLGQESDESR
jgi:uncharacterized protein